jgi:hypothetical protein
MERAQARSTQTIRVGEVELTIEWLASEGAFIVRVFLDDESYPNRPRTPILKLDGFGRHPHWHLYRCDGSEKVSPLRDPLLRDGSALLCALPQQLLDAGYSQAAERWQSNKSLLSMLKNEIVKAIGPHSEQPKSPPSTVICQS